MTGNAAALATAILWTVTAITFEYAGKRIGAMALNFLRLAMGAIFLGIYGLAVHGSFAPFDAPASTWAWMGASGLVGLVLGDLFLFQAFIDIGARISMLIYALAPAFTAIIGRFALGERLPPLSIVGMGLTLVGIAAAVLGRPAQEKESTEADSPGGSGSAPPKTKVLRSAARGTLFALLAALGQAGGLILSKIGAPQMDAFSGTQMRVLVAVAAFAVVLAVGGGWRGVVASLRDRKAAGGLVVGSFFGPFLGVSLSLAAVQGADAGVAASIMSLVPVLIIGPSVILFKEKLRLLEVLGAIVAVAGTALLFI